MGDGGSRDRGLGQEEVLCFSSLFSLSGIVYGMEECFLVSCFLFSRFFSRFLSALEESFSRSLSVSVCDCLWGNLRGSLRGSSQFLCFPQLFRSSVLQFFGSRCKHCRPSLRITSVLSSPLSKRRKCREPASSSRHLFYRPHSPPVFLSMFVPLGLCSSSLPIFFLSANDPSRRPLSLPPSSFLFLLSPCAA